MSSYRIDADGTARDISNSKAVAIFREDGEIVDPESYQRIGWVRGDGTVVDAYGTTLGYVASNGRVTNTSSQEVGKVDPPNVHRQGALLLIL